VALEGKRVDEIDDGVCVCVWGGGVFRERVWRNQEAGGGGGGRTYLIAGALYRIRLGSS
jgi:hypothetical protein